MTGKGAQMPPRRGSKAQLRKALAIQAEQAAEQAGKDWLHDADDDLLACRAQGHAWPKLRRGRQQGISSLRQRDGSYMIRSECRDCGTARTLVTLPGGALDYPARYTYEYPRGYASPKGSGVTRRDALDEIWRRNLEDMRGASDG